MLRLCVVCVLLALGRAGAAELPGSPAPRPALPQIALVLVEEVTGSTGGVDTRRVVRVPVRNGKLLPADTIWEGNERFLGHFGGHRVVADRYFVTKFGGVIDLRDKKVLYKEQDGQFCEIDGTKVVYGNLAARVGERVHSFDLATGKVQKDEALGEGKYLLTGVRSPDGNATIESGPVADELVLHQVGSKPKSLGPGFRVEMGPLASVFGPTPVFWLNDGVFVTQRGNGKLVTVDVAGKVTELVTIKDAPKDLVSAPYFFRDGSNRLVYVCGKKAYLVDVEKKTAALSEWRDLGHGFEASWERQEKFGHKLRHNGKEFASINCWPHTAMTAPGLLAVTANRGQEAGGPPDCVAVWSVAVGEWQSLKLWPNCLVGWVKP